MTRTPPAGPELVAGIVAAAVNHGIMEDDIRPALALKLGVSRQLVHIWERGRQPVSAALLPRLLAVDPSDLCVPPEPSDVRHMAVVVPLTIRDHIEKAAERAGERVAAAVVRAIRDHIAWLASAPAAVRSARALCDEPVATIRARVPSTDLVRLAQLVGPGLGLRQAHVVEALRRAVEKKVTVAQLVY